MLINFLSTACSRFCSTVCLAAACLLLCLSPQKGVTAEIDESKIREIAVPRGQLVSVAKRLLEIREPFVVTILSSRDEPDKVVVRLGGSAEYNERIAKLVKDSEINNPESVKRSIDPRPVAMKRALEGAAHPKHGFRRRF